MYPTRSSWYGHQSSTSWTNGYWWFHNRKPGVQESIGGKKIESLWRHLKLEVVQFRTWDRHHLASVNNLSENVRVGNHISYIRRAIDIKGLYWILVNSWSVLLQVLYARFSLWPNFRHVWLHNRKRRVETLSWHYEIPFRFEFVAHAVNRSPNVKFDRPRPIHVWHRGSFIFVRRSSARPFGNIQILIIIFV